MQAEPFPLKSFASGAAGPDIGRAWYTSLIPDHAPAPADDVQRLQQHLLGLRGPVRAVAGAAVSLAFAGVAALVVIHCARLALRAFSS